MLLIVVLLYSAISVAMIFAGYVTKSKFSFEQSNGMMKKSWTPCSMKRFYSYKFSFSQARSRKRFAATDKTLEKKETVALRNFRKYMCDGILDWLGHFEILILKTFKGALSGLKQLLATESPLKMMKNAFYFTSKALFVFKTFKFLSWLFGHVAKRRD